MKKILIIQHVASPGGIFRSGMTLLKALESDFDVTVMFPVENINSIKYEQEFYEKVIKLDRRMGELRWYSGGPKIFSLSFLFGLKNIVSSWPEIKECLFQTKPDLVITNSKVLCWLGLLLKRMKIKSICFIRETKRKSYFGIMSQINKYLLNCYSGVVFISSYDRSQEYVAGAVVEIIPDSIEMPRAITAAIRQQIRSKLGITYNEKAVLYVGGMQKLKGADTIVDAISLLIEDNIVLIFAGKKEIPIENKARLLKKIRYRIKKRSENKIYNKISSKGLMERIKFVGVKTDLQDYYYAADVLAVPNRWAHQSRPAFEAGAYCLPVIMADHCNIRDEYIHKKNCLLFPPGNAKKLADGLREIVEQNEIRMNIINNNYDNTRINHNYSYTRDKLIKMINLLLKKEAI